MLCAVGGCGATAAGVLTSGGPVMLLVCEVHGSEYVALVDGLEVRTLRHGPRKAAR